MTSRRTGTGLQPNVAAALAYSFGAISGIVFLMIERDDQFVRFHAWQSTLTFLGALLASLLVSSFPVFGGLLNVALSAGLIALWVLLMVKAFSGEKFKLPYVGEIADHQIR
ncbi:MAG: hypothetical protein EPO35_00190 [Acidobacteria bacterium]|nr:MAG: hypothetical protein EPO35_00190 [Acidobacteriota bacterium]